MAHGKKLPPSQQEHVMPASVVVGDVGGGGEAYRARFRPSPNSVFTDYMVENRYEVRPHVFAMPITKTFSFSFQESSTAFVQLAEQTVVWIADWTASRINARPDIPSSIPQGAGWVLLDRRYEPAMIIVGPDGRSPVHRVSGTFTYGRKRGHVFRPNTEPSHPAPPWLDTDGIDRTLGKEVQGIIDIPDPEGLPPPKPAR